MKEPMNKFIKRMRAIKRCEQRVAGNLTAYYTRRLKTLESIFERLYGEELRTKLFDVYDEHCPDDEIKNVLEYVSLDASQPSGVEVYAYDFPGAFSNLTIKIEPLRIELKGIASDYTEVVWTEAA